MKNYDEMTLDVLSRIKDEKALLIHKRSRNTKIAATCLSLVLVVGLSVGIWQGALNKQEPAVTLNDSVNPGEKDWIGPGEDWSALGGTEDTHPVDPDYTKVYVNDPQTTETDESNDFCDILYSIRLNEITGRVSGSLPDFEGLGYIVEQWDYSQAAEHLGIDLRELHIPNIGSFSGMGGAFEAVREADGDVLFYSPVYWFDGDNIKITACRRGEMMPSCCVWLTDTEYTSTIYTDHGELPDGTRDMRETEVIFAQMGENFYTADFTVEGLTFSVEVEAANGEYDICHIVDRIIMLVYGN